MITKFEQSLTNREKEIIAKLPESEENVFAILEDGEVKKVNHFVSTLWWGRNQDKCQIAQNIVDNLVVSTVFLPVSYNDRYFETMIFCDQGNRKATYKTLEEAIQGHNNITTSIRNGTFDVND